MIDIIHGDCLTVMRGMEAGSVDAIVTDPPAGIKFMGKEWDAPGAFVERQPDRSVAWDKVGGNHNPTCSADRARTLRREGKKFRDRMTPIFGEMARVIKPGHYALVWALPRTSHWTGCAIEDSGWEIIDRISHIFGQGFPKSKARLKPACEDWWLCRAPGGGKVRELEIDRCRVGYRDDADRREDTRGVHCGGPYRHPAGDSFAKAVNPVAPAHPAGRYPPNLCLTHHPDCVPAGTRRVTADGTEEVDSWKCVDCCPVKVLGETNGVDRFFPTFAFESDDFIPFLYSPKSSRKDRGQGNIHPTVKPQALMRWLCRLICPPGGMILDPFAGSGTTGVACLREGFHCILIESEPDYISIIRERTKTQ